MEKIEVFYMDITGHGIIFHKYIVYTYEDENGITRQKAVRAGPEAFWGEEGLFGEIVIQEGEFNPDFTDHPQSEDRNLPSGTTDPSEIIKEGEDLSEDWEAVEEAMRDIAAEGHNYAPGKKNSNSAVDEALDRAGLDQPEKDGWDEGDYLSPGSGRELEEGVTPDHDDNIFHLADKWLAEKISDAWEFAKNAASPLVLDLDGDGIELISLENSQLYWDIDEDGFSEHSGWASGDDGFLAIDLDNDGAITAHTELFGSLTQDGFTALSLYDTNADSVIDANDAQFADLLVWQDVNENGMSEAGELYTLADLDIISINLNATTPDNLYIEGHNISHVSSYTVDDGVSGAQTLEIVDAWFEYDNLNSTYNEDYTLDILTMYMPTVRGYGELPDLYIAMSIDNGNGGLLEMVLDLYQQDAPTIFSSDLTTNVNNILYRWAGVEGIDPTSRGPNVDARNLAFLEKLIGEEFLQRGYETNPRIQAGKALENAFEDASQAILARLVLQGDAQSLFEGDVVYNSLTDNFETLGELDTDFLADMSIEASSSTDVLGFWKNVLFIVSGAREGNITSNDATALDIAIAASDPLLSYADVYTSLFDTSTIGVTINGDNNDNIINGTVQDDTLRGNDGNDTLNGEFGDDLLEGDDGNDVLNGGHSHDILYGGNGNDILNGGYGEDLLYGGYGNDTYIYNLGDGYDTIRESKSSEIGDKIIFGAGIEFTDLSFNRLSNNDLSISIDAAGGQGEIVIENQFSTSSFDGAVETLEFDDSTTFDLTSLSFTLVGTDASETLSGVLVAGESDDIIYGEGGNDTINGYTGSDQLHGGDGDDTIYAGSYHSTYYSKTTANSLYGNAGNDYIVGAYGDDYISGGTGNDTLKGSRGNDEYYFSRGDGHDTITELDATGYGITDTIILGPDIMEEDVTIIRIGSYDLKVMIDGGQGGSITIIDQFSNYGSTGAIEAIQFDDSTLWDLTTMGFGLVATEASETLHGNNSGVGSPDDIIYGEGGNDTIYGYLGSDQLHGGDGDDTIYAGTSSSTYYTKTTANFLYGDAGNDTIYGAYGHDHVYGGSGDDNLRGQYGNDHYYFERGDGNDSIVERGIVSGSDNIDTIHLGETILITDLSYARNFEDNGNHDLTIMINGGSGGTITLVEQFKTGSSGSGVEYIQLHDDTLIDLRDMNFILTGTAAGETLNGSEANSLKDDIIYGEGGNDTINGYTGSDQLHGGDGDDTIYAGTSSSTYYTKTTANFLYGDAGNDTIYGAYGHDHVYGGSGDDNLRGQYGNDHYYFERGDGNDSIVERGIVSGSDNIDTIHLGETILITDLSYARNFEDNGNHDLTIMINGGSGGTITLVEQFKTGSSGSGVEYIQLHDDTLIDLRDMNFILTGTAAGETLNGSEVNSLKDDIIYGEGGNDTINGYHGSDQLHGGDGDDIIHAGTSSSTYYTKTTSNELFGDAGNDTLYGANGDDHLHGGSGDDTIYGRNGDDLISGGDGVDTLNGGSGADTFIFDGASAFSGIDTIDDFSVAQGDKLDLSDMMSLYDPLNDAIADFIEITDNGSNSVVSVDLDGGADNFVQIATLLGVTGLTDEAALETSGNLITA